ncbi:MAG: porin [Planctomycetes bacterium]|nr:porin [Planctomycetota bacterium]
MGALLLGGAAAVAQPPIVEPGPPPPADPADRGTPPAPLPAARGLQWQVGDFQVRLGGYVKVDLIHDFDEIGSTDSFDVRTIPTDDESDGGTNTRLHARQTRINLDLRGPTSAGDLRIFVEGDFFGEGNSFRLRHAFGTIGPVLAGQTWSTFMDEDTMPEVLDFENPIAYPLIRQAMIRFRQDLGGGGSYWAVAVEDPASRIEPAPTAPDEAEEATPDLTARLRWQHGAGHCQLGLFAGTARYDPAAAPAQTELLWGLNLSANLQIGGRDRLFLEGTYGPGIGRYRGGITATVDPTGDLEPVTVFGGMIGYEHHWCPQWRSTFVYSRGDGDLPAGAAPDLAERLEYGAANLLWQFSDRAWAGVEYLYGARENADRQRGEAHRLQFAIRFDI